MKKYVFFYLMKENEKRVADIVPSHVSYWKGRDLDNYQGGPFSDRSGGLITFLADSIENAEKETNGDPFVKEDVLSSMWLKEWRVE